MTNRTFCIEDKVDLKRLKIIFFSVFTFGLVAHGYSYFNGNFSHDSLFDLYEASPEPMIAVGRYFRPVYRLIRGDFALPVIGGFLFMLFMALSVYLLKDVLQIKKTLFLILTCGILVTNYSVTLLNATFIHDTDSYGLALFPRSRVVWLIAAINIILLVAAVWLVVKLLLRNSSSKRQAAGAAGIVAMMPFGINVITIIADQYHELTIYSLFLCYIFVVVLLELYLKDSNAIKRGSILSCVYAILLCIIIFDNCIFSNEAYLKKDLESAATLSVFTRIIDRMEQTEGYVPGETESVIIGILSYGPLNKRRAGFDYDSTGLWFNFSTTYHETYESYMNYYLGYPVNFVSEDKRMAMRALPEVENMPVFPAEGSIKMIDDVMVIKLSEMYADTIV